MHAKTQGNGLLVVLIIISAIAFGIYSVSDLINGELRFGKRAAVYTEAKQAAEGLIEQAVADLHTRFENSNTITEDVLSPERNPLRISDEFLNLYTSTGSNLVIPEVTQYNSTDEFFSQDTEIIGGRVSPGEWVIIDPNEVGNQRDQDAGLRVFRKTLEVFGKATVNHPSFGDITVYASQLLEIRDIRLFDFAIFYNLPMEIAPGPVMDVYKNVHVNGDAWFQSGNRLNFHDRVSIAGEIQHGRHPDNSMNDNTGEVNFTNSDGDLVNMRKNDLWPEETQESFPGTWLQSIIDGESFDDFNGLADQIWGGNLIAQAEPVNLPGVSEYIEDTDLSTSGKQAFNSAYSIIQPTLDEIDLPSANDDPAGFENARALRTAERNKFAYKAGLTIEVGNDGSLNYFSYERDSYNRIIYDGDGSPRRIPLAPSADVASSESFSISDGNVAGGLRDNRQGQDMNLINVDVSVLRDLVHSADEANWGGQDPENWWNGVVYVKFPQESAESTRPDNVNPASARDWGVKLVNGDAIPNPEFAQDRDIFGTTIATNQAMYVEGHYNSDGDLGSGDATEPDNADTFNEQGQEAPAALAADAITFLSEGWNDANSNKSLSNRIAEPTEVSAAILTGLVPSGKTGANSYSGGVENFPRFLEKWSGKDFVMRGSIVAMFESEVATEPWGKGDVYNPPRRKWGFHSNYTETSPPGGPIVRSYRARDLKILSEDEYRERVLNNW